MRLGRARETGKRSVADTTFVYLDPGATLTNPPMLALYLLLAISPAAPATQGSAEPLFVDARIAALRHHRVSYTARYRHSFILDRETWSATGTVFARRPTLNEPGLVRVDAELRAPGSTESERVSLEHSGDQWTFVNHSERWFTRGDHAGIAGVPGLVVEGLALPLYDTLTPFSSEEKPQSEPAVRFRNTLCSVLMTESKDNATTTKWLLDSNFAPRFVERTNSSCCGEDVQTRLDLDPLVVEGVAAPAALALDDYANRRPQAPAGETSSDGPAAQLTHLTGSASAFIEQFNAAADKPRVIGVFAPT